MRTAATTLARILFPALLAVALVHASVPPMPDSVRAAPGKGRFSLPNLRGKVVLVVFFQSYSDTDNIWSRGLFSQLTERYGDDRRVALDVRGTLENLEVRAAVVQWRALERYARRRLATAQVDPEERQRLLTFVMIGGGPTGVELAGALAELVRRTFPDDYPSLDVGKVRIVLLEALDQLLPAFSDRAGSYAHRRLSKLGVEVKLGTMVEAVEPGRVRLEGGEAIAADTVVWTAGVAGSALAEAADLPTTKKGTVPVDEHLRAEGDRAVYIIGDCAHFESGGEPLPMVAQVAIQQGRRAADNILREIKGEPLKPFQYTDLGMMAVIGRGRAVVQRKPVTLTGALAWPIWALVHIGKLVGFRNRLLVMVNWAASYLFSQPGVRLILPRPPTDEEELE